MRFTPRAGAAPIDTCSRFCVVRSARALGGRVAYAVGYTGLGVGATRFGARVALDLLDGARHRAHPAASCVRKQAAAVPARAAALGGDPGSRESRWPAPTSAVGDAARGYALLDRLGLGFDT